MSRATTRSVALSLALCAMVLRALLPDGWMPAANAAGPLFVVCSVDGTHAGGKAPGEPQQRTHAPCAFATAAPLSPPAVVAVVARIFGDATVVARSVSAARPDSAPGSAQRGARAAGFGLRTDR